MNPWACSSKIVDSSCPAYVVALMKIVIVLRDELPNYQRPRRLTPMEKAAID